MNKPTRKYFYILTPDIQATLNRGWSPVTETRPFRGTRKQVLQELQMNGQFFVSGVSITTPAEQVDELENGLIRATTFVPSESGWEFTKVQHVYIGEYAENFWCLVDVRFTDSIKANYLWNAKSQDEAENYTVLGLSMSRVEALPDDAKLVASKGFVHIFVQNQYKDKD